MSSWFSLMKSMQDTTEFEAAAVKHLELKFTNGQHLFRGANDEKYVLRLIQQNDDANLKG